jgi:limonene 1,2-monooxygenase
MTERLRFGAFLPPVHKAGINPTLALQQDIETITWLDRCGYDEVWCGEHHSAGSEIWGAPEILIAAAAQHTRHIKLGTGVVGLAYHNPLWVAERMVMLDHLTRGRVMLGVGPGSLPSDSNMIGLTPDDCRRLMPDGLAIVKRLLTSDEPVTFRNERWNLQEARLQLRPYSNPLFDLAVASVASPTGPKLAGRFGAGLLSIGATTPEGFAALAQQWGIVEEEARHHGQTVSRANWRLVGMLHCAETEAQARRDVAYGMEHFFRYLQDVAAYPHMTPPGKTLDEMIATINDGGLGAIGTPDRCAAQIQRLLEQSGGFGAFLLLAHDWAPFEATKRSFELMAREVFPRFQGQARATLESAARAARARELLSTEHSAALDAASSRYRAEVADRATK